MNCLPPVTSGSVLPPIIKGAKIASALLVLASLGSVFAGLNGFMPFLAAQIGVGGGVVGLIAVGVLFGCKKPMEAAPAASATEPTVDSTELLVPFYTGDGKDCEGRTLEEILAKDDAWLEKQHDYIQWLFSTSNPSRYNHSAPLLNDENISQLRSNRNIRRAFVRMMQFYGLKWGDGKVERAENWDERREKWLTRGNHNYQRITRIITSLRALGFETEAQAFWQQLMTINAEHSAKIGEAYRIWMSAAN